MLSTSPFIFSYSTLTIIVYNVYMLYVCVRAQYYSKAKSFDLL